MNKAIKFIMVLTALAVVIGFFAPKTVDAAPPPPIDVIGDPTTGANTYELGGCVTGQVKDFLPGYLINVALLETWNAYRTEGLPAMPMYYWSLPGGPDDIFTCITVVKIMQNGEMLTSFPTYTADEAKDTPFKQGSAEVCLNTPMDKEGYIYYYDEFKLLNTSGSTEYPNWVEVGGPFPGGSKGCVPIKYSGVYAFYSPEPNKAIDDSKFDRKLRYELIGSVVVPIYSQTIKSNGPMALGGCVTGNVEDLAFGKGYEMRATLITDPGGIEALPDKVGEFYECIIDLRLYKDGTMIDELPVEDGNVTICFAIPPYQNGTVYYFDKYYGVAPEWTQASDNFKTGIACSPVYRTGYYGMVDVQNP
jgi:hypothetical protein